MSAPVTAGPSSLAPNADGAGNALGTSADLATTLALAILVLTASAGFARIYSGASWVPAVVVTVITAAAAAFLARLARCRRTTASFCGLLAVWISSSELVLGATTQHGLPLLGTLRAASEASRQAAAAFMAVTAPVHPRPGFELWSAWGAGAAFVAADWLAVRRESLGSILPPLLLFVTTCVLGVPAGRTWAVGTFITAALLFGLVQQWAARVRWPPPKIETLTGPQVASPSAGQPVPGHRTPRRPPSLAASGTVFIAVAVVAGVVVVPALGKEGSGAAGWRRIFNTTARVTPDPLVSIRTDLLQGARAPVFVAQSTAAAYWRLTSLQYFDGTDWTGSGTYRDVNNRLSVTMHRSGQRQILETFHIQELGSPWLPVAFQPEAVSAIAGASYDPVSGSLLVHNLTADGESYRVVADDDQAAHNPAVLAAVGTITAKDRFELAQFLRLPPGIPANVRQLARRLAPAGADEFQKALGLQDFFHRPPFVYTLAPPDNSSGNSLVGFLFHNHAGYCQQYASAYAVLARLVGLPTRVAVGFTTGTPIGRDKWQVFGGDAHAWPEVWFPTVGWVPFEPTPGFAIPSIPYTGTSGNRLRSGTGPFVNAGGFVASRVPAAASSALSTVAKGAPRASDVAVLSGTRPHRYGNDLRLMAFVVLVSLALWAALVRAGQLLRWRRRRLRLARSGTDRTLPFPAACRRPVARQTRTPGDAELAFGKLLLVWEELAEVLGLSGLLRSASETPTEFARRAGEALRDRGTLTNRQRDALAEIGELFSRAAYSGWRPPVGQLVDVQTAADQIARRARAGLAWRQRLPRYLDPRTTWRPVAAGPDFRHGVSGT